MDKIKIPLVLMACAFAVSFFDGALELGLPENFYVLLGFMQLGLLVWMLFVVFSKGGPTSS